MTTLAQLLPNGDTKRILSAWIAQNSTASSKLQASGLIARNEDLNARAAGAGNITGIPFYNALEGDSAPTNDDLSDVIEADNMTGGEMVAVRQNRAKAWQGGHLASLISGLNTPEAIAKGVADWKARDFDRRVGLGLKGVAALVAADAEMTVGSDNAHLDFAMLADAAATKGDTPTAAALQILIVHSQVYAQLLKTGQIDVVRPSDQSLEIAVYGGKYRVVVCDQLAGTAGVYTSVLAGAGAFAVGEAPMPNGMIDTEYSASAGNGSGGEKLIVRINEVHNVQGFSWKPSVSVGVGGPTDAQLSAAASYTRQFEKKNIPLVFIKSKVGALTPVGG